MPTEKRVTVTAIDEHIAIITDGIGPPQLHRNRTTTLRKPLL